MNELRRVRVQNVDEGIALANEFKASGKFDWFRGQTRPWPPRGSSFRRSEDPDWREKSPERLKRFFLWAQQTSGLEELMANRDAFFAVAQHYGIPTNYIDFTTDPGVAGFFACDTQNPAYGEDSCIYCLNTEHLKRNWPRLKRAYKSCLDEEISDVDVIDIEVANLWRLQAQKGRFLYFPMAWDQVYPMYTILFPYTGYPAYPVKGDIYPDRKSQLEIVLDQYFSWEESQEKARQLEEFFQSLQTPNKFFGQMNSTEEHFFAESFIHGQLDTLASWNDIGAWLVLKPEEFESTQGNLLRFAIDPEIGHAELISRLSSGLGRLLERPAIRGKSISWVIQNSRHPEQSFAPELTTALHTLWDGMRSLPYSNTQIARGMAVCVALHKAGLALYGDSKESLRICTEVFGGDAMEVEFGSDDGSYSKALVRIDALSSAVRVDIKQLLTSEKFEWYGGRLDRLFQLVQSPKRLFDFMQLADIFAEQIVPSQVLFREVPIFFSPARIDVLGNP